MPATKCPCCKQKSNLRKLTCAFCDAYSYSSRAQIRDGLHPCRCGHGQLEPVCLEDRARCFPDTDYGREAWAEFAWRFPSRPDPVLSSIARKGAQTKARHKVWAAKEARLAVDLPF